MDFFLRLKSYIEDQFTLYKSPLSVGLLVKPNDIALRPTPGGEPEKDMDGSRYIQFPFQILTRHENEVLAFDTCQEIALGLDGLRNGAILSANGTYQFITCNLTTTINFVERDSYGGIYTALLEAELYLKEE